MKYELARTLGALCVLFACVLLSGLFGAFLVRALAWASQVSPGSNGPAVCAFTFALAGFCFGLHAAVEVLRA